MFSLLDKFQEKYHHSYLSDIIPDLKNYINSGKTPLKESDIKGIAGTGGLTIVFETGKDEVLKCSLENPLEFRKHNSSFDIPFLSPVENFGKTYFVRTAKAETTNITKKDCKDVISRIFKAGCEPSKDLDEFKFRQFGKYNNKTYLLDTRAAVPRPDKFSRFIYDLCEYNKRIYRVIALTPEYLEEQEKKEAELLKKFGPKALHIDETPRANLSVKKGVNMLSKIMKDNMKHGKAPLNLFGVLLSLKRLISL